MGETSLPPSIDPGQRNSLYGTIQFLVDKLVMQELDDMMPAKVIAFNRATNRVTVQILIAMINTANQQVIRAQIASVPVMQFGGGGAVISFPIAAGDTGWIKATDTDISLFIQNLSQGVAVSPPNTKNFHKFDSSVFIADTMLHGVTISGDDVNNAVWQNFAGTTKISLGSTIRLKPSIGVGAFPRTGAIIDAPSTTKAIGFPAMSTSQKNSIASPQAGYAVFDTTLGRLSTYNGSTWS